MSLKDLEVGAMIALTGRWLGPQRGEFLAVGSIAGLLPAIERVHEGLLSAQKPPRQAVPPALLEEEARTDAQHDHCVRALHYGFEAALAWLRAQDTVDETRVEELEALRAKVLPDGLAQVQKSYLAESGDAARTEQGLTAQERALLKGVHVAEGAHLGAVFRAYAKHAARLGELEHESAEQQRKSGESAGPPRAVQNARNQWIRAVGTVLDALEQGDASEDQRSALRSGVDRASSRAGSGKSGGGSSGATNDGTPPDAGSSKGPA